MDHTPRFLALVTDANPRVGHATVDEIRARQARGERFHLIDVREDREWDAGRVAGAVHLGKGLLERDIERAVPDADADIVLYCAGGYRSVLAADALARMGYARVTSMDGGFRAWTERGFPTEK